jgi:hypothetical protein
VCHGMKTPLPCLPLGGLKCARIIAK